MRWIIALLFLISPASATDWCPVKQTHWFFSDNPPAFVVDHEAREVPIDTDGWLFQTWDDSLQWSGTVEYRDSDDALVMLVHPVSSEPIILKRCPYEPLLNQVPLFIEPSNN